MKLSLRGNKGNSYLPAVALMTLLLLTGCATAGGSTTDTDAALSFVALLAAMYLLQRTVAWLSKASFYLTLAVAALVGAGALLVVAVISGM